MEQRRVTCPMGGSVGGGTNSGATSAAGGESEETSCDATAVISREKAAEHSSPSPTSTGGDGGEQSLARRCGG